MSTTNNLKMTTIYPPSLMSPNNKCINLQDDNVFSCIVNGIQIDSFRLKVMTPDSVSVFDTGSSTSIANTDSKIVTSGTWTKNANFIIDDTNSSIQYYGTGWGTITNTKAGYYNNTVHGSAIADDYLQYVFTGTGINCYFTKGKDKGIFSVLVDGVDNGTVDLYNSTGYQFKNNAYSVTDLPYSSHTIKFVVSGDKYSASTSANIEFDYFQVLNTNGSKNSSVKGDYIEYPFTSNGIELYMDFTPDSGIIQISVDGVNDLDKGTVDLFSSTYAMNSIAYTNMNLTYGEHKIRITNTGTKNTQSSNSFIYFDSLTVTNKTVLADKLYDKDVFLFQLPANSISQLGALKWSLTLWNSSNDESISSGEYLFTSMSTPILALDVADTIISKETEFKTTYSQDESIPIKSYQYSLYAVNYEVRCGKFGQNPSVDGAKLNMGKFTDTIPTGYRINCGKW